MMLEKIMDTVMITNDTEFNQFMNKYILLEKRVNYENI